MSDFIETIENIASKIPGYGGYLDREKSRDTDKSLREYISKNLYKLKDRIDEMKSEIMQKGIFDYMSRLDNISSILDRLSNSVLYSSRGFAGLFGANKIYEEELEKLYNFDRNFLKAIDNLEERISDVWKTEEKDFSSKIDEIRSIVMDIESDWKSRENVINSFQ